MLQKVLIANRGEIAVRVIRTCRSLGISTVAVYSEVDKQSLHVLEADEAVCIGAAEPSQSYLDVEKILQAAKETGANGIHPGYGFLSENAGFATACKSAGLIWIGPEPSVIEQLGDKLVARKIMEENQVPTVPGVVLDGDEMEVWKKQAEGVGFPLLIKAAAGGGGKGMRVVRAIEDFESAYSMASSEARSAFGDERVFLERYVENPRHIEFQILADTHGNVVHLFERECSIQRRHQKIIEETPSPILTEEIRRKMGDTAVQAAKASGYTNAGTVEFLFDPATMEYYFLEVNTRLQVEHPITELITGLDLVEWQIKVANGMELPWKQEDLQFHGHAFECRIYAENPEMNFAPSPGPILALKEPQGPGIRVDSGVYTGVEVSVFYDPILSKVVVHAENRESARLRMIEALKRYQVVGVQTGIPIILDVFHHPNFIEGNLTTHFLDEHFADWSPTIEDEEMIGVAAILDQLLPSLGGHHVGGGKKQSNHPSPWETLGTWRMA